MFTSKNIGRAALVPAIEQLPDTLRRNTGYAGVAGKFSATHESWCLLDHVRIHRVSLSTRLNDGFGKRFALVDRLGMIEQQDSLLAR